MSNHTKPLEEAEAISGVVPKSADPVHKALPNLETMPVEALINEMLERLNDHDYVGTLVLAELILRKSPEQGVAVVCRKEVLQILAPMLEAPLVKRWPESARCSLHEAEHELLGHVDETTTVKALLAYFDPVVGLHALHVLLRAGAVRLSSPR